MGTDGMEGLALAILGVSVLMLAAAIVAGAWIGRRLFGGTAGMVAGACVGLVLGVLAVIATFFETTWDPPRTLTLAAPPGVVHRSAILLEDSAADVALDWQGWDAPLMSPSATLALPPSGLLRVQSLEALRIHDREVFLASGERAVGMAMLRAPPGIGATDVMIFEFGPHDPALPDPSAMTPEALAAMIRAREAGE